MGTNDYPYQCTCGCELMLPKFEEGPYKCPACGALWLTAHDCSDDVDWGCRDYLEPVEVSDG